MSPEVQARPEPPALVSWNVTAACNLRCPHCYLDAGRARDGELSTAEALALVDEMAALGTEMVVLTGGEPLLRRDLHDIARRATDRGLLVVLGTNGVLLDAERARRLADSGVRGAGISLDSLDPERHDAFRGVPGAWRAAVGAMDACRQAGLGVVVQTTVLRDNLHELPDLAAFAAERGAHAFNAYFLVCTGRGEELTDITREEHDRALEQLVDLEQRWAGRMVVRAKCAPHARRVAASRGLPLAGSSGCMAGTSYVRVGPTGEITPCPYMPEAVGSVRGQGLGTTWRSAPLLAELRRGPTGPRCGPCEHARSCGGCRARAMAAGAGALGDDPWCDHVPAPGSTDEHGAEPADPTWTDEARARLSRIPSFLRKRIEKGAEAWARQRGDRVITVELLRAMRGRGHPGR